MLDGCLRYKKEKKSMLELKLDPHLETLARVLLYSSIMRRIVLEC